VSEQPPALLPPGPTARTLTPIEGRALDPPDADSPLIRRLVDRSDHLAWLWRWWERFRDGRGTLSAKGIAFYSFFGVLSGILLAFLVVAQLPQYEELVIRVIDEALPGLVDPTDVSTSSLQSVDGRLGVIGAVVLLYSALGIIRAIDDGVRLVYGTQYQPRNFVVKNLRYAGYLLLLTPLVALSYLGSSAAAGLLAPVLDAFGIGGALAQVLLVAAGFAVALGINAIVIAIVLRRLGGIEPGRGIRRAALLGGVSLTVVQWGTTVFVSVTLANPRWFSFGAPVAMLLLFYAMAVTLLVAAALVATANEDDPVAAARRRQPERPSRFADEIAEVSGKLRRD
jgi:membrane protein